MKNFILAVLKEMTGAPAEFQVLPAGKIEVHGDEPAYLDEAAAIKIIAAYKARGNDMVIDYEHQSLADVQSPAAGWIKDIVWKGAEGLWAVVEWTAKAAEYLKNREYRYFSPVMLVGAVDRKVALLVNVALTNNPAMNNLRPIVAKATDFIENQKKEDTMLEKLKKLLGLAADAGEDKIVEGVTLLVNKCAELTGKVTSVIACKEVLDALGAKPESGKDEVVQIVASLKAPADVAKTLSLEVAALKTKIAGMEQADLVALALKEGKTSPEELDKWGRDLALKNPESFKQIVLSRPAGSVIPVTDILVAKEQTVVADDVQRSVNKMMGIDDQTFTKYNK
ncbi:MAG: hypothetical protein CVU72_00660 [Deltaproteobacteria bacterium HGW-Deltaproteobacteria-7]|jgi:phage I-like protein|nr:MAG: hypothetical protein CVU72_00660 [Deltaproteobacteria bacterium HGW-Deltaproteobacteria-7]PKN20424.1 MAG: hypothetical protein CVU71_01130 [Deltaproteobacteria bacterium HGW-Deltaproteobacteria-6]